MVELECGALSGGVRLFARATVSLRESHAHSDRKDAFVMATATKTAATTDRLQIDFLFLDLDTCTRCRGTDRSLQEALARVRELLASAGVEVEVNKLHVESAEQARELRFVTSPTLRVSGRDIALELRESSCGSEACTDGCGEATACRVWVYQGREYTEPPVAMVVEAILREIYAGASVAPEAAVEPYELPENLVRFFAGKSAAQGVVAAEGTACCSPTEQRACCEPEDKADCCGAPSGEAETTASVSDVTAEACGCR